MRTPAFAIAWQLWTRHRRGMVLALGTLAAMVAFYPPLFALGRAPWFVAASLLPMVGLFGAFLNAMLFADEVGDMASGYPRRMYALPVRTATLVTWPMLYGALVVGLLWLAVSGLVYRRSGLETPLAWPALAMVAGLAWIQAITWAPFASPWARFAAAGVILPALATGPALLFAWGRASTAGMLALLAAYLVAAYAMALAGVARDRRGDTWRLRAASGTAASGAAARAARRRPFGSPAGAQLWYEWRCHGLVLPLAVLGVASISALIMVVAERTRPGARGPGALILTMPLLMAGSFGVNLARMGPSWARDRGSVAFVAIRPARTGALVAAKFLMAALSVALAWGLAVAAAAAAEAAGGRAWETWARLRDLLGPVPGWKVAAVAALGAVAMPTITWRMLTDSVACGLTGRRWIADGSAILGAGWFIALLACGLWVAFDASAPGRLRAALPWLVAAAVLVKGGLATWAFRAAARRGLIAPGSAAGLFALWLGLSAALAGLTSLILPPGVFDVPWPLAWISGACVVPLARFPLAVLALDWDRHR
jgi:hypothetical protein